MIQYAIAWQPGSDNLGDDLRTLAAMQLLPRVDHVLNVNRLDEPIEGLAADDRVVALLSGNALRESAHWLPDRHIAPVYVGVHVSREDVWGVPFSKLDGAGRDYLMACAPIGCRDERTLRQLDGLRIPHALTGCVTLTLQKPQVKVPSGQDYICCVDVPEEVTRLLQVHAEAARLTVREMTHQLTSPSLDFRHRMHQAENVVKRYAGARFVVTRRLHCAMACLAVGTPVLLLYHSDYEDITRFAPLDGMVRTQPVDAFLQEVRSSGMPVVWSNPTEVEEWREKLLQLVAQGLQAAETRPLPIVPEEAAHAWRAQRTRLLAESGAEKIHKLERQQYESLHEKFAMLLKEDTVKGAVTSLMEEKELRRALRKLAGRRMLRDVPLTGRPLAWLKWKLGILHTEDLHESVMEQLRRLGWPERRIPDAD